MPPLALTTSSWYSNWPSPLQATTLGKGGLALPLGSTAELTLLTGLPVNCRGNWTPKIWPHPHLPLLVGAGERCHPSFLAACGVGELALRSEDWESYPYSSLRAALRRVMADQPCNYPALEPGLWVGSPQHPPICDLLEHMKEGNPADTKFQDPHDTGQQQNISPSGDPASIEQ